MSNKTFTMIKPDAVADGYIGGIINQINEAGFRIVAMKMTQLSRYDAEQFYAIHKERPFFGELVEYMTSGPIVAAILEKDNAVESFRKLIGATDPAQAEEGTIRKKYAKSIASNAIHGSDSGWDPHPAPPCVRRRWPCLSVSVEALPAPARPASAARRCVTGNSLRQTVPDWALSPTTTALAIRWPSTTQTPTARADHDPATSARRVPPNQRTVRMTLGL